jgi:hypothetical protein
MLESTGAVHVRLTAEAEDRLSKRLQNASTIGAGDAALLDHKYAIRRIDAMSEAQLQACAIDVCVSITSQVA